MLTERLGGPSRRAWLAMVAAVFLLALGARAWQPQHLGLGHYDEGVYAISAEAVTTWPEGDLFPGQTRFSPPVWFATVGAVSRVLDQPPHQVALALNVLIGALTAAAAAAIGTSWFGLAAGLAAGVLVAFDPLAIVLSRSGLTDPTFTLLFLLAVAAAVRALRHPAAGAVLGAGVLTGLAWNTKYHGWFAIVIGGLAVGVMMLARRRRVDGVEVAAAVRRLVGTAVVAGLVYLPWALYMRGASGGRGLRGIVSYYLTLIGGDWLANAGAHLAMQGLLDGPLLRMAAPVALLLALPRPSTSRLVGVVAMLAMATWVGGGAMVVVALALIGIVACWQERLDWPSAAVFGWLLLWIVAAPVYHPYARLLLPFTLAVALVAGRGVHATATWMSNRDAGRAVPRPFAALVLAGLAVVLAIAPRRGDIAEPWRDTRDTERVAAWLDRLVPPGARLLVVGEPSVAYHVRRLGRPAVAVVDELASLDTATVDTWVAAGVYARRSPSIRDRIAAAQGRGDSLGAHGLAPGDLRLLDDLTPARARAYRHLPDHEFDVVLYRIRPTSPPAILPAATAP